MPLSHERQGHYEKLPHEEIIEVIERGFEELNARLDSIEAALKIHRR